MGARGGEPARRDRRRGSSVCEADCQDAGGSWCEGLAGDGAAVEKDLLGEDIEHAGEEEGLGDDESGWMVNYDLQGFKKGQRIRSLIFEKIHVLVSVMTGCFATS